MSTFASRISIWRFIRIGSSCRRLLASRAMTLALLGMISFGANSQLQAYTQANLQTASDNTIETIPLQATVQVSPPQITIQTYAAGTFSIYRKDPSVNTWTPIAAGVGLAATGTWTDSTVSVGTAYEYKFVNTAGTADSHNLYPTGYIICGIQVDQTQSRGRMALVVASDIPTGLPSEYAQYKADLVADGWTVHEIPVPRAANYNGLGNGTIATVKVNAGGTGFTAGDLVYLTNSAGKTALGKVTATGGVVSAVAISAGAGGKGFAANDALTVSGGSTTGTGASLIGQINAAQASLGYAYPITGGSGYTDGEAVTLTGQTSGKTAQATLTVDAGEISYFSITSSQTGFVNNEFLVMTGNTAGAGIGYLTAYVQSNSLLAYVYIHPPGTGYIQRDPVTLTGQTSGKTAQGTLNVNANGTITSVTVTSSQTGFSMTENLMLSGASAGSGVGVFYGTFTGPLQSLTVSGGGTGYVNGNVVTITGGDTSATGTLVVSGGAITGATITSAGSGFYDGGSVSLSGLQTSVSGYNFAVLTVDNTHTGRGVTITAGGSGYRDNDRVSITGASSGATATGSIIAPAGAMIGISAVLPNTFTPAESLTLSPASGGSGAAATAGVSTDLHLLIRSAVQSVYQAYPGELKNIAIIGKVPVCRSGINDGASSDGHGNEAPYGADAFYADMDSVVGTDWTDTQDNSSTSSYLLSDFNLPGDNQYDQQRISQVGNGVVELGFGRVDLSLGIQTETEAMRTYFNKLHRYKVASADFLPGRRVCDRWTYPNEREADLQSMPGVVGMNNIEFTATSTLPAVMAGQDADQLYTTLHGPYLFYFKGSGGPSGGVGGKAVFWTGMQSHWGFWYQSNLVTSGANAMQKRLAEESFTLSFTWNIWGLRYLYHRMGMGLDAGDMMKQSINNQGFGAGPYAYKFNNAYNYDHHGSFYMNHMGDPALRLFMFEPPSALSAVKTGGNPMLTWTASPNASITGYHIYRAANANAPFTRLTSTPVAGTTYTDTSVGSGSYVYMVRAVRLETTGGGTFSNASLGITQSINLDATPASATVSTTTLSNIYWNTATAFALSAQGGVPQYSWTLASGALPSGMTLSPLGVVSGTPAAVGNFNFTVQATDQVGQQASRTLNLTVNSNDAAVVYPEATTYTNKSAATTSYGTEEIAQVSGNANAYETFHRYDLSGLPLNNGFVKATLFLYVTSGTATGTYAPVQANLIADAQDVWVDKGVSKPFSGYVNNGSNKVRINCTAHGFTVGTLMNIAGLTGTGAPIAGPYAISAVGADYFDIAVNYVAGWAYDPALAFATTASMYYNTRPTSYNSNVPTINATGTDTPGTFLQFDVTSFVRETLANDPSKKMSIRFFTTTPQTVVTGSENAFGGGTPYLVLETSNAPSIAVNSPTASPACVYSGSGILLNATVTALPARAGALALQWTKVSGPGTVTFTNSIAAVTGAGFSAIGDYVVRLTASDGLAQSYRDIPVRVLATAVTGPMDSSLRLRLALDESSGTTASDASGVSPANNGTLVNSPTWSSSGGKIGGALTLGTAGQKVTVPDSATNLLDGMQQMSVSMWIYANSLPVGTSNYYGLIAKRVGAFNKESYNMQLRGSAAGTSSPVYVSVIGGTTLQGVTQITTGKWYHLVMVFDGTQSTNNLQLYVNGSPDKFITITPSTVPRNSTAGLMIGANELWNFDGLIDEVRVYSRALTLTEVQDLNAAVPSNLGPVISTAPSLSGAVGQPLTLTASVTDDGKPAGALTYNWSELGGPIALSITTPNSLSTSTTPGVPGLYGLQFSASDGSITTFANVSATITGESFASWVTANNLSGSDASILASPAGDGISNLMKYALGLNPKLPCASATDGSNPGLPLLGTEGANLTLTYQRDTAKTDITYLIETCADLTSWSNSGVTEQILTTNGTIQTVKASVAANQKAFMRLRVTK